MSEPLMASEVWDFSRAEWRKKSEQPRAVVSVAFAREDFELVSQCAESLGMYTSAFIRRAAISASEHLRKEARP